MIVQKGHLVGGPRPLGHIVQGAVVIPQNQAPVAYTDSAQTAYQTPVDIDLLSNDIDLDGTLDASSVEVVTQPTSGTVSINPLNGIATYTPSLEFYGTDTFEYRVADDQGAWSEPVAVSLDVAQLTRYFMYNSSAAGQYMEFQGVESLAGDFEVEIVFSCSLGSVFYLCGGPTGWALRADTDGLLRMLLPRNELGSVARAAPIGSHYIPDDGKLHTVVGKRVGNTFSISLDGAEAQQTFDDIDGVLDCGTVCSGGSGGSPLDGYLASFFLWGDGDRASGTQQVVLSDIEAYGIGGIYDASLSDIEVLYTNSQVLVDTSETWTTVFTSQDLNLPVGSYLLMAENNCSKPLRMYLGNALVGTSSGEHVFVRLDVTNNSSNQLRFTTQGGSPTQGTVDNVKIVPVSAEYNPCLLVNYSGIEAINFKLSSDVYYSEYWPNRIRNSIASSVWGNVGGAALVDLDDGYLGVFDGLRIEGAGATWHRAQAAYSFYSSGEVVTFSAIVKQGSSPSARLVLRSLELSDESVVTAVFANGNSFRGNQGSGDISDWGFVDRGDGTWLIWGTVAIASDGNYALAVGPNSGVSGDSIIVYGGQIETGSSYTDVIPTYGISGAILEVAGNVEPL